MTYKKKLIEVALPLKAISAAAAREKSIAHGSPVTLHRWWARRPQAAARAILFAQLVDDPSADPKRFPSIAEQEAERDRLFSILERLVVWENANDEAVLSEARAEIEHSAEGSLPRIVDPFSGGATIPLEAQRLGLPAYGGDLNPVATLIGKALVEVPPRFAGQNPVHPQAEALFSDETTGTGGLASDVAYYGEWMRERALQRIGDLYPKHDSSSARSTVIAWIWARTVRSPDPSWEGHVPLVRSWILRRPKRGKPVVWIEPDPDPTTSTFQYKIRRGGSPPDGTVHRGVGRCLATGTTITKDYIKSEAANGRLRHELIAVVVEAEGGRDYREPTVVPEVSRPEAPELRMARNSRHMGPPEYGFETWGDLFLNRQLVALNTFSDLVGEARQQVLHDAVRAGVDDSPVRLADGGKGAVAYADAVATYLAFVVDKCLDFWCSLSSWDATNNKVRVVFARQVLPMTWDFAEVNPFSDSVGNWRSMLKWVVSGMGSFQSTPGSIEQRDAEARVRELPHSVVSTDPPYYDNVPYADLSDFYYVWLRQNLRDIWPDVLSTLAAPKAEEIVADRVRAGSAEAAQEHFESGIAEVFAAVRDTAHPEYPSTVFYAFKQTESDTGSTGWETFLSGLIANGFQITATWPVRTEKPGRARAQDSSALASSVVLAIRPRAATAQIATRAEFIASLRSSLPEAIELLQKEGVPPVDMAQSAIGPGMSVFSQYSNVLEASGESMSVRQALITINEILDETISSEEAEMDPWTRFAVTWYEQYGLAPGPFGDAETLAKARGVSVEGVRHAGVLSIDGSNVRLTGPDQLDEGWDPREDPRLTIWEVTHHLIRRLDSSELDAGELMALVGDGVGDRARKLAYLLYQAANRRGSPREASRYDSLVQVWPDLARIAGRLAGPIQQRLGE